MQLVPRQPLRRLQWRLTGLFIIASALTTSLIHVALGLLVAYLLLYSPDTMLEIENTMREKAPQMLPYFQGKKPDKSGLTRLLDQTLLNDDTGRGLQFHLVYVTIGKFSAVIAAPSGEVLASSPDQTTFSPDKSLYLSVSVEERLLIEEARRGIFKARWCGSRIVAAAPIQRGSQVLAIAFARSEPLSLEAGAWMSFVASLFRSLIMTGIATAIVGGLVGYCTARSVTARLLKISAAADAWAGGDLTASAPEVPVDELGLLAQRLNQMAGELQQVMALRNEVAVLEERQRITRDLHDTIKQEAFATAMMVGVVQKRLNAGDVAAAKKTLEEVASLSRQMQTDLSSILMQLRSAVTPTLTQRLEEIANAWNRRSELTVHFQVTGTTDEMSLTTQEQVTRIVEEAVANAVKHSRGTQIRVELAPEGDHYRVAVTDDGIGFEVKTQDSAKGMGLTTMRERVALLPGGRLEIDAPTAGGTQVTFWFKKDGKE